MPALSIREDRSSEELRRLARRESDCRVVLRLVAIANALDGMSRAQAARQAGMDRQSLRDWVIRYNADGIAGLGIGRVRAGQRGSWTASWPRSRQWCSVGRPPPRASALWRHGG